MIFILNWMCFHYKEKKYREKWGYGIYYDIAVCGQYGGKVKTKSHCESFEIIVGRKDNSVHHAIHFYLL